MVAPLKVDEVTYGCDGCGTELKRSEPRG
jgi:hypothetical protein